MTNSTTKSFLFVSFALFHNAGNTSVTWITIFCIEHVDILPKYTILSGNVAIYQHYITVDVYIYTDQLSPSVVILFMKKKSDLNNLHLFGSSLYMCRLTGSLLPKCKISIWSLQDPLDGLFDLVGANTTLFSSTPSSFGIMRGHRYVRYELF